MNNYVAVKVFDAERHAKRSSKKERKLEHAKERIAQELSIHRLVACFVRVETSYVSVDYPIRES